MPCKFLFLVLPLSCYNVNNSMKLKRSAYLKLNAVVYRQK